jgi:hypothetical protein
VGAAASKSHQVFAINPATKPEPKAKAGPKQSKVSAQTEPADEPIELTCLICGEPVEQADAETWVHAEHANDDGDHSAQVSIPNLDDDLKVAAEPDLEVAGDELAGVASELEADEVILGPVAEVGWDEALTPIPDTAPAGDPTGVALLVGGADLVDSTATLIAYLPVTEGGAIREVLHATVTPEAEEKLRDALGLSDTVMVPTEVVEDQLQQHPYDLQKSLYSNLETVMKKVNKAIKTGSPIDPETISNVQGWAENIDEALVATAGDLNTQSMLTYYQNALSPYVAATVADTVSAEKFPKLTAPWTMTVPVTVTKMVPAPPTEPTSGLLPTKTRVASRLKPTYDSASRTVSWDGKTRSTTNSGTEYTIDLGDGYSAVYRPTGETATQLTLRGQLELIAPPGTGHGPELVRRLGQLHLVNRALTGGEGEWTYLQRNITAQGLTNHPEVLAAQQKAQGIEDAQMHILVGQRGHQAAGLDDTQLARFATQLTLDAEAAALPDKVRILRDGVAKATGYKNGDDLDASDSYRPTPSVERGWLTWSRFDAIDNPAVTQAWKGRRLAHHITAGNLYDVVASGVLASTERRQLMGIKVSTMSPEQDKHSGGATSVFLRVQPTKSATGSSMILWDEPTALVARADWYSYNGDAYGAAPQKAGNYGAGSTYTTNPLTAAAHHNGSNEIMFRHGIDLIHGPTAPSRIICATPTERDNIRAHLAERGITHIGKRTVEEVITC